MAKEKLELKKADDMKSGDVGEAQNDFDLRWKQAHDEIRAVLEKYKVDIGARLEHREDAILAIPRYIDMKGK